ncbi:ABC transporter substrate-binding protein [Blautia sp. LMAG:36]|uniref:ABC transporter substrate-binding protein n=1 Tax=Blautia sp. LMAG:36 TaxID=1969168 RepID=UPI00257CBB40|nr:hypothetical protein [Blautia sp. LMAG:36]
MKKQVFCGVFALALAVTGCGVQKKEAASDIVPENRQELTILHVDAGTEGFDSFISQAEKDLGIKIHIEKCPANADNRQAKIATLLTSGDDSVDLITVNDEMISEFKHKGFLLPLEDTVMTEETAANFLQEYLKEICMSDGHIFSVPFRMDIMAFWVNQECWIRLVWTDSPVSVILRSFRKSFRIRENMHMGMHGRFLTYIIVSASMSIFSEEIIQTGRIRKQEKRQNI